MLKILITRFWPVLLPLVLYLAWLAFARRKAGKEGTEKPGFFDGPWLWPTVATMVLAIASMLYLGLSMEAVDGTYIPAHQVDGKVVPGRFVPRDAE